AKLFIYLPNSDLRGDLICSPNPPPNYDSTQLADGTSWPTTGCTWNAYDIRDTLVDTKSLISGGTGPAFQGDDSLHIAPYVDHDDGELGAIDEGNWKPSSGYKGLLGKMDFANTTTGATEFMHIN
ncbi:MAG: hypothetical protein ACRD3W_07760, partial [Terriglobales bacterium]